jgi:hypothetical protein
VKPKFSKTGKGTRKGNRRERKRGEKWALFLARFKNGVKRVRMKG